MTMRSLSKALWLHALAPFTHMYGVLPYLMIWAKTDDSITELMSQSTCAPSTARITSSRISVLFVVDELRSQLRNTILNCRSTSYYSHVGNSFAVSLGCKLRRDCSRINARTQLPHCCASRDTEYRYALSCGSPPNTTQPLLPLQHTASMSFVKHTTPQ